MSGCCLDPDRQRIHPPDQVTGSSRCLEAIVHMVHAYGALRTGGTTLLLYRATTEYSIHEKLERCQQEVGMVTIALLPCGYKISE